MTRVYTLYTDGSYHRTSELGGWAWVDLDTGKTGSGNVTEGATSNRMEIQAALAAVRHTPEGSPVEIISDSTYLVNGINQWRHKWARHGWTRFGGDPVLNEDLWRLLDEACKARRVIARHVHRDICEGNRVADKLANDAVLAADSPAPPPPQTPTSGHTELEIGYSGAVGTIAGDPYMEDELPPWHLAK